MADRIVCNKNDNMSLPLTEYVQMFIDLIVQYSKTKILNMNFLMKFVECDQNDEPILNKGKYIPNDLLKKLVKEYSNTGTTILYVAARNCSGKFVELILDAVSDRDKKDVVNLKNKSDDGSTPLHGCLWNKTSTFENKMMVAELLLEAGANSNIGNNYGETAVMNGVAANPDKMKEIIATLSRYSK
jgi:ankyrin repeat protein